MKVDYVENSTKVRPPIGRNAEGDPKGGMVQEKGGTSLAEEKEVGAERRRGRIGQEVCSISRENVHQATSKGITIYDLRKQGLRRSPCVDELIKPAETLATPLKLLTPSTPRACKPTSR